MNWNGYCGLIVYLERLECTEELLQLNAWAYASTKVQL